MVRTAYKVDKIYFTVHAKDRAKERLYALYERTKFMDTSFDDWLLCVGNCLKDRINRKLGLNEKLIVSFLDAYWVIMYSEVDGCFTVVTTYLKADEEDEENIK